MSAQGGTGVKCDFCDRPATKMGGSMNGMLACDGHSWRIRHHSVEKDVHGDDCMCPWCSSDRLTYCLLTRGAAEHADHMVPGCPARITPPEVH